MKSSKHICSKIKKNNQKSRRLYLPFMFILTIFGVCVFLCFETFKSKRFTKITCTKTNEPKDTPYTNTTYDNNYIKFINEYESNQGISPLLVFLTLDQSLEESFVSKGVFKQVFPILINSVNYDKVTCGCLFKFRLRINKIKFKIHDYDKQDKDNQKYKLTLGLLTDYNSLLMYSFKVYDNLRRYIKASTHTSTRINIISNMILKEQTFKKIYLLKNKFYFSIQNLLYNIFEQQKENLGFINLTNKILELHRHLNSVIFSETKKYVLNFLKLGDLLINTQIFASIRYPYLYTTLNAYIYILTLFEINENNTVVRLNKTIHSIFEEKVDNKRNKYNNVLINLTHVANLLLNKLDCVFNEDEFADIKLYTLRFMEGFNDLYNTNK